MSQAKPRTMARLDQVVYAELERKVSNPLPIVPTTELEAGYMLGVQAVLKHLRDGYVIP